MTTHGRRVGLLAVAVVWVLAPGLAHAQEPATRRSAELLNDQIEVVQDSTDLDDATRRVLVDLYRRSIRNLEARTAYEAAAESFRRDGQRAPAETEAVRRSIERRSGSDPIEGMGNLTATSTAELQRRADEEVANLTAVEAKLAVLEASIEAAGRRPGEARARVAAARAEMEDLAGNTGERPAPGETAQVAEARRGEAKTRLEALRAEIVMLDQELLSHAARVELLQARRDEATLSAGRIRQRVDVLRSATAERRREEVDRALAEAREALDGASSDESLVRELAEANLALVESIQGQVEELDRVAERDRARPRVAEIDAAFRSARRKLDLESWTAPVGAAILAERRRFPSEGAFDRERRELSRSIVRVGLRLIESEDERRAIADVGDYLDRRVVEAGGEPPDGAARAALEALATTRRSLLDRAVANDRTLQARLYDLDDALQRVTERLEAYDAFLARRLLWVRSTGSVDLAAIARLPREIAEYLRPDRWVETVRESARGLVRTPLAPLGLVAAIGLFLGRGRIRAALVASGRDVDAQGRDGLRATLRALLLSVLLAAPVPLALGAWALALATVPDPGAFPAAVGDALLRTALWIALPILMLTLWVPEGVAHRHLGWDPADTAKLRSRLIAFVGVAFPAFVVLRTSIALLAPSGEGATLPFLCFLLIDAGLLGIVVGTVDPTRGAARSLPTTGSERGRRRWRFVGYPLTVAVLVAIAALGWFGYTFAAQELLRRMLMSLWTLVAIWLVAALVSRWLTTTGRRLAEREAAGPSRDAGASPTTSEPDPDRAGEAEEGEVDLVALGDDSRRLLHAAVVLTVAIALVAIWEDVLPALGVLGDVGLWTHTVVAEGIEQVVPVTLYDLLLAVVVGLAGTVLAKNLPSLLDIVLLKQGGVSASGRYTAGTLTRYAVTAVAVLWVLGLLGASASQLGWAAAALGVGIGFGLQEIVANFICGLILLFERPVRVGDIVTIGDASGIVSKIRIRATTIRDWEQKELIVPNKELITGRLLNWTLSDSVTRVLVQVGVAYGTDVDRAMSVIAEVARDNPLVLDDPEPRIHFEQFGDSALQLSLRAYIKDVENRLGVQTDLHRAIDRKFRDAGIVIAFPQRDVHVYTHGDRTP